MGARAGKCRVRWVYGWRAEAIGGPALGVQRWAGGGPGPQGQMVSGLILCRIELIPSGACFVALRLTCINRALIWGGPLGCRPARVRPAR